MKNGVNIKEMFDKISAKYDKLNEIMTFGLNSSVKIKAIKNIPLKSDVKVLDVCCGTGDIAIHIAKNIAVKGEVTGVDFSSKMLEIAKNKAQNLKNITFFEADALNLPFAENEFDACFISFGLRNLEDLKNGLEEMKRVVKPGGYVVNLDTGKPKGIFKFFHKIYFHWAVPVMGKIFGGNYEPYKYLTTSAKDFPSSDELVELFKQIGLKNVSKHEFLFGAISQQFGQV